MLLRVWHPLGLNIFNLYSSDIPTSPSTNIAQFADDTVIFMSNNSLQHICTKIQCHLKKIEDWSTKWKIKLNPIKSTAKIFSLRPFFTPTPLQINNNIIPWTPNNQTIKYLGLNFDTRLNWKSHIDTKIQQTKIKLIQLKPLLNPKSSLSLNNAIILYKSIIRPSMLYACPIWTNASESNIKKIQIMQNKFLRLATHAPWFISNDQLHRELNLPSIKHHIAHLSNNFYSNISSINQIAHYNLAEIDYFPTRIKNRHPLHAFLNIFSDIN